MRTGLIIITKERSQCLETRTINYKFSCNKEKILLVLLRHLSKVKDMYLFNKAAIRETLRRRKDLSEDFKRIA